MGSTAAKLLGHNPPPNGKPVQEKPPPLLKTRILSSITRKPIEWFWDGWIPFGMLSLLDGDPGLGKSTMAADWSARVTRGWEMSPRGGGKVVREPAGVIVLSGEDSPEHTIHPRLQEAGADLDRVILIDGVQVGDEEEPPVLPMNVELIADLALAHGVKLITIDPLMAYIDGRLSAHSDQDVRRCLHRLKWLAERTGAVVLALRHLNKMTSVSAAKYRGGGSIGIIAAARAAMVVGHDPEDPNVRVLAMNKLNIAPHPRSVTYGLDDANGVSRIGWGEECDWTADEVICQPARQRSAEALEAATEFLTNILADGPVLRDKIIAEAKANKITERTLKRAKKELNVGHYKAGFAPSTQTWHLPGHRKPDADSDHNSDQSNELVRVESKPLKNKGLRESDQEKRLVRLADVGPDEPGHDSDQAADVGPSRVDPTKTGKSSRLGPTGQSARKLVRVGDGYKVYDTGTIGGKPPAAPAEAVPELPAEDDPDYWAKMATLDAEWAAEPEPKREPGYFAKQEAARREQSQ